jgi:hypothetical protein
MPFFKKPTLKERFTPKEIKLSKLYTTNTAGGHLSDQAISQIKQTLQKSGFSDTEIRNAVYKDQPVTVAKMKQITEALNRNQVYGFEKSPETAIKTFLNKERVKAQSIAGIRREHILEASTEEQADYGTTSLNPKSVSPNAPKPGESSILRRRNNSGNTVRSLSGKAESQTVRSLADRPRTSSLSPLKPTTRGGGVISAKPKF